MPIPSTWRQVEITQNIALGFTLDVVIKFIDWDNIDKYIYIVHDKDYQDDCVTPREPHIHLALKFKSPVHTETIIKRLADFGCNLPDNMLQKIKSFSFLCNYYTHRDEHKPYKHVYDVSEVFANFDWTITAESAHDKKLLSVDKKREKEIVDLISSGTVREFNMHDYITAYEEHQYHAAISHAQERFVRIRTLKEQERDIDVVFVCGQSGFGKDRFCIDLCKRRGLAYSFTNNSDNLFDDYMGQPVLIWSDARDYMMMPNALFNFLDNYRNVKQKARYHDKLLTVDLILINSIIPLWEWYPQALSEDKHQIYRRIQTYVDIRADYVNFYHYDDVTKMYGAPVAQVPNRWRGQTTPLSALDKYNDLSKILDFETLYK